MERTKTAFKMKILFEARYTENSMDRGAWQAAVHVVTKSQA